jgi:basic membrane protein A
MVDQRRRSRPSGASRALRPTSLVALIALLAAACGGAAPSASAPVASAPAASEPAASPASPAAQTVKVFGAFATEIEEPWDGVIHSALEAEKAAGRVDYSFQDAIGYSGDMERVLREVAERDQPAVIFGDAFGNEEAARRVAAEYPEIAFVFGSGGGPAEPNFSVFDNWIHEPAYLAGMLAGGLTKSNTLGVVGGYPVPEVTFLNSWFDPAAAKEAALAQVGAGADVLFAERFGVIEAASENDLVAIGNMSDQKELAPQNVVSSVTWNMKPTVAYVIDQVMAGAYTAQDLKDFSMVGKGGAALAEINTSVGGGVPADLVTKVQEKESAIKSGTFRVDINEATPPGATVPAG